MIDLLLFALLIRFTWQPPAVNAPPVDSYKVCIGTTPGTCTVSGNVNSPNTQVDVDLDVSKVWYAVVTGKNVYGTSDGSNQVVLGKPFVVQGLTGSPSGS